MSYAELHCKTNFSFLEGASHAHELVERAAELGYAALAVTDRNTLAGVVRAHRAAKESGLKLIIGAEITPTDTPPLVLWAPDRAAYGRLSRLITLGRRRASKGNCKLCFDDIADHADGMLAGIVTYDLRYHAGVDPESRTSATVIPLTGGAALSTSAHRNPTIVFWQSSANCSRIAGYLLSALHCGPNDRRQLDAVIKRSAKYRIPLAATGGVYYHSPARLPLP